MSDDWPAVWRPREDWGRPTYDEGGVLPQGLTVAYNDTGKPTPVYTAEQVEQSLAWIRDHYGPDGTFRCPSGSDE